MESHDAGILRAEDSTDEISIPQSTSNRASGTWPQCKVNQGGSPPNDLSQSTHTVGHIDIKVMHENGVRMEPRVGSIDDLYFDPDRHLSSYFDAVNKINYIPKDAEKFIFQKGLKQYRIPAYYFSIFSEPSSSSPIYKRLAYERMLEKLAAVDDALSARYSNIDLSGVDPNGYVLGKLLNNIAEIDNIAYITDFKGEQNGGKSINLRTPKGKYTMLSQSTLSNRFEQAIIPITPRMAKALQSVFRLYHSGFPWFKRPIKLSGVYNNFSMPFDVHNQMIIVNGLNSSVQGLRRVLDPFNSKNRITPIDFTMDNLTYNPPMYDVGQAILNIPIDIADHISGKIRSSVQLRLLSYMESSTVIMQALSISSNRASAINAVMASLSNSAASSAVEPIITAMACNFVKISVDLPMNARPTTILAVLSLMLNGSHIYDNRTVALIHNMYVEMVMGTHLGSNSKTTVKTENQIRFTMIRDKSERHELLAVPPFQSVGRQKDWPVMWRFYVSHLRVLCHFHGILIKDIGGYESLASSSLFETMYGGPINNIPDVENWESRMLSAYDSYFGYFGGLPNGFASNDKRSCLRNILPEKKEAKELERNAVNEDSNNDETDSDDDNADKKAKKKAEREKSDAEKKAAIMATVSNTSIENVIGSSFDVFDKDLSYDKQGINLLYPFSELSDYDYVVDGTNNGYKDRKDKSMKPLVFNKEFAKPKSDDDIARMIVLGTPPELIKTKFPIDAYWRGHKIKVNEGPFQYKDAVEKYLQKNPHQMSDELIQDDYINSSGPLDLFGDLVLAEVGDELDKEMPCHWKAKDKKRYVLMLNEIVVDTDAASLIRVRPIVRGAFYEKDFNRSDTRNNGKGLDQTQPYEKAKRVLSSFTTVSEMIGGNDISYVKAIMQQMTTDRFLDLAAYFSEMASVTTLADYCPAGYTSLMHLSTEPIDLNNPTAHRKSSCSIFPFSIIDNKFNLFSVQNPRADSVAGIPDNDNTASFKLEPQNYHKVVKLEWSSIAALNLLGIAPPGGPDISAAIDLIYDAKAFNHDVTLMRYGATIFNRHYNAKLNPLINKLNTEGPLAKVQKLRNIMKRINENFPVSSSLTSKIDQSLDNCDLKQNHFFKTNPYIDSSPLKAFGGAMSQNGLVGSQFYTLPFLRTKPITPLPHTIYLDGVIYGYDSLLVDQLSDIANVYINSPLSFINRCKTVYVSNCTMKDESVALTRVHENNVVDANRPEGLAYIPVELQDSPLTDIMWTYSKKVEGNEYNSLKEISDKEEGIMVGRSHERVYNRWLTKNIVRPASVNFDFKSAGSYKYTVNTGIYINFKHANNILERADMFRVPELVDYSLESISVGALFTTPDQYILKEDDIEMDRVKPYRMIPILPRNVGPYISRLEKRTEVWPAGHDYTISGSFTEGVRKAYDKAGSSEFNTESLGAIMTRMFDPINFVNPTDYINVSIDPMAPYDRT